MTVYTFPLHRYLLTFGIEKGEAFSMLESLCKALTVGYLAHKSSLPIAGTPTHLGIINDCASEKKRGSGESIQACSSDNILVFKEISSL